jgi:hypothetical protein
VILSDLLGKPIYPDRFDAGHTGVNSRRIILAEKPLPGIYMLTLTDHEGKSKAPESPFCRPLPTSHPEPKAASPRKPLLVFAGLAK